MAAVISYAISNAATIGNIITAAGGIIAGVSAVRQGQYQSAMARANAKQARMEAEASRKKAEFDIQQHRRDVARFKGTQKMSFLKSGVQLEGSALEVLADTEVQAKMDEDIIRYNAESRATQLETSALQSTYKGRYAKRAGRTRAVTSLLSTAGKFAK